MTDYTGTVQCDRCGKSLTPTHALYTKECWSCTKARHKELLEKRMAP